jgi:hypothetical protein
VNCRLKQYVGRGLLVLAIVASGMAALTPRTADAAPTAARSSYVIVFQHYITGPIGSFAWKSALMQRRAHCYLWGALNSKRTGFHATNAPGYPITYVWCDYKV